ncbi:MAG: DUF3883 domain-containing protein [Ignavibacteria bacterium]|nr:DUF3883 domain-containing protein [Ignavibacteria bacterium]
MNTHDLRQAQISFNVFEFKKSRRHLHKLRDQFVKDFSIDKLKRLPVNDYVIGAGSNSFCYRLERELDGLGRILGATAQKFGVYFSQSSDDYIYTKKWGENLEEAYKNILSTIIDLIIAGRDGDVDNIVNNKLSTMFKGKILSTYYPERYLNIFSNEHLNHYLSFFGLDFNMSNDPVYKRNALISYKNKDKIMKNWDNETFAYFLYSVYPQQPIKDNQISPEFSDYSAPLFPFSPEIEEICLTISSKEGIEETHSAKSKKGKVDYEREYIRLKQLGERGEEIVKAFEIERLKTFGENKLANKVDRVSLVSDSIGYDILSFNQDGTERHIEVKATQAKAGSANFFLTINELNTAQEEGEKYYLYIVFEILTHSPKVWVIKNPFSHVNPQIKIEPINFRVKIVTE